MTRPLRLIAPTLLLAAGAATAGCYTTAHREPFARRDANVEVEGLPLAAVAGVGQLGLGIKDAFAWLRGDTPNYLHWARVLNAPDGTPDEQRQAMLGLARYEYGRKPPYTEAYAEFARRSPHALVRATAVRVLNISRDPSATPLFAEKLQDEAPAVRLEAAKALANVPADEAAGPLLAVATNPQETIDVRLAAIDALRHYDNAELKQGLARLLEADDFSLAWQARRSLVTITGQDHGYDLDAWRRAIG